MTKRLKVEHTPEEWAEHLRKQREWYAKKKYGVARSSRHGTEEVKRSLRIKKGTYDRLELIAREVSDGNVTTVMRCALDEYVNAWFAGQAIYGGEVDRRISQLWFALLSILRNLTEDDEHFRTIIKRAVDGAERYGGVDEYLYANGFIDKD